MLGSRTVTLNLFQGPLPRKSGTRGRVDAETSSAWREDVGGL